MVDRALAALDARIPVLTPPYNYIATLALELAAGWLDYVTGPTVSVSLFYLLPLALAACGPSLALAELYAGVAALIAAYVDIGLLPIEPGGLLTVTWNVLMEWGTFSLFVLVLFRVRQQMLRRASLSATLQIALREIQTLEELLPICSWCKAIRLETGTWLAVEDYLRARTPATLTQTVCPDCIRRQAQPQSLPPAVRAEGGPR